VLSIPLRGGTYDFQHVDAKAASDFYARSRPGIGSAYAYRAPPPLDDGWPVATPEEVGLSRAALETFVRAIIDMPIDSLSSLEIHGVLMARQWEARARGVLPRRAPRQTARHALGRESLTRRCSGRRSRLACR